MVWATAILFSEIGWYGAIVFFFDAVVFVTGYMRGKTERNIEQLMREKRGTVQLQVNEAFNNIKTIKLFGWESNVLNQVSQSYDEEMQIEEKWLIRAKLYDAVIMGCKILMPITVFGTYTAMGNELTLSKLTLCTIMLT